MTALAALILAGGRAKRMGGADKAGLLIAGTSLLDRVIGACSDLPVVVVGPERPTVRAVIFTRESPPGGGPVAALAAGLPLVDGRLVALLAADLPFLTADTLDLLGSRLTDDAEGALLVDDAGSRPAAGRCLASGPAARVVAAAGPPEGLALGRLLGSLTAVRVRPDQLPAGATAWHDCDTPEDLVRAEELA